MANGASKIPSFHTDFKNVNLILVKSAPQKVFEHGRKLQACQQFELNLEILQEITVDRKEVLYSIVNQCCGSIFIESHPDPDPAFQVNSFPDPDPWFK
jgi:hypothetical protein